MTHEKTAHPTLRVVDGSWQVHRLGEGETIAVPAEFSSAPTVAPLSVHMRVHRLHEPVFDFARRLMGRRVRGAETPSGREASIDDHPTMTFGWTDGVLDLETEFVDAGEGIGLEISYGSDPNIDGAPSMDQVKKRLAEHVEVAWPVDESDTSDERSAYVTKQKQSLYFPEMMLEEIRREASRLDRSLSWVVQRAWKLARREIRVLPSSEPDSEQSSKGEGEREASALLRPRPSR